MRSKTITVIAVVNAVGAILTAVFWSLVFFRIFAAEHLPPELDAGSVSTTFGFMVADLLWALLLLVVSVIGLWQLRPWGWLAAQMINILWIYSMTVIWCRDIDGGHVSPGAILFLPFVPFAVWAIFALWRKREDFGLSTHVQTTSGQK
ncbi:MAG: hypothetical protein JXL67_01670 [Calditrichaeota bacterium]|nr:hypothetical protein [Calditrichota bacterium]